MTDERIDGVVALAQTAWQLRVLEGHNSARWVTDARRAADAELERHVGPAGAVEVLNAALGAAADGGNRYLLKALVSRALRERAADKCQGEGDGE